MDRSVPVVAERARYPNCQWKEEEEEDKKKKKAELKDLVRRPKRFRPTAQ
jgi:hypothetical protein